MGASSSSKSDQAERFREAARALECDDDDARFDEKLRQVAKAKPKPDAPKDGHTE